MNRQFMMGLCFFLLTMLIYSVMDSLAKSLLVSTHIVQIGWGRFAIHTLILVGILIYRGEFGHIKSPDMPLLQLLRSVFLLGVMLNMYFALQTVSLANVSALVSVAPFIVAVGASLLLRERVGKSGWVAIVVGFMGAMVIIRPGFGVVQWTALFALAAAFCFAGQQLVSRQIASHSSKDWVTLFYTACIALVILSFLLPLYWHPVSGAQLVAIVLIGMMAALGDALLFKSFSYTSASSLAPYGFSIILFGGLLGWVAFGEIPDFFDILGAQIIVVSGIALLYYKNKYLNSGQNQEVSEKLSASDNKIFTEMSHPALHYERMIGDMPRMNQYRQAINQAVGQNDVVADLGTGLGILSMMAAQAGARKVYAIDLNPNSLWMAKKIAEKNGVADKIEFINANAQDIVLDEKVDVVVSELIGEFGCEEGVIETVTSFATKNLSKNGKIIPTAIKTFLVPVEYKNSFRHGWIEDNAGLDLTLPMSLAIKEQPVKYYLEGKQNNLANPEFVEDFDFSKRPFSCRPDVLDLSFTVNRAGIFHGFIGYFDLTINNGIRLANYPRYMGCHWENWNWPVNPHIKVSPGDIIDVKMSRAYESGTQEYVKQNKDTTSGWEPKYDWCIKWKIH